MTSDLCDSLNSMFADLIESANPDEDITQDYLREEESRLCLEGEEKMRCEHQKFIVEENRIRLDEAKRLRLEEENMLQLEQQNKNKRKEFMNSNHCKKLLSKLTLTKRKGWLTEEEEPWERILENISYYLSTVTIVVPPIDETMKPVFPCLRAFSNFERYVSKRP
nr:phospholipase-like protein [Tanacetum cinerariifolium]